MSVRNTIIQSVDYSIERLNDIKKILHCKTDTELDKILLNDFIELGGNILNNIEFQKMILNRYEPHCSNEASQMNNDQISDYYRKNWDLLVDINSIIIDPNLFLA